MVETALDSNGDCFRPVSGSELGQDVFDVHLDGVFGNGQFSPHLFVPATLCNELRTANSRGVSFSEEECSAMINAVELARYRRPL